MKNLTEKQQAIILDITKEFIKINEEKNKKPKGSFFDIRGLLEQREADIEERHQIEQNNNFYDEILKTKIQEDMDMLNIDLKELGLRAWQHSNWADWVRGYVIDTIDNFERGLCGGHEIVVRYRLITKTRYFESGIEHIEESLNKHNIECCGIFFNNLEEFTKNQNVIGKIKVLINRTNL